MSHRPKSGVVAAMFLALVSASAVLANGGERTRSLSAGFLRSTDPSALVLSLRISGGYGSRYVRTYSLHGDGRLEEKLVRVALPGNPPESHMLAFNEVEADLLLNRLIERGVVGLTEKGLLTAVQRTFPTATSLISGEDCDRVVVELHLLGPAAEQSAVQPVNTSLSIECVGRYARAYASVPEAAALADLVERISQLSTVRGEP